MKIEEKFHRRNATATATATTLIDVAPPSIHNGPPYPLGVEVTFHELGDFATARALRLHMTPGEALAATPHCTGPAPCDNGVHAPHPTMARSILLRRTLSLLYLLVGVLALLTAGLMLIANSRNESVADLLAREARCVGHFTSDSLGGQGRAQCRAGFPNVPERSTEGESHARRAEH